MTLSRRRPTLLSNVHYSGHVKSYDGEDDDNDDDDLL